MMLKLHNDIMIKSYGKTKPIVKQNVENQLSKAKKNIFIGTQSLKFTSNKIREINDNYLNNSALKLKEKEKERETEKMSYNINSFNSIKRQRTKSQNELAILNSRIKELESLIYGKFQNLTLKNVNSFTIEKIVKTNMGKSENNEKSIIKKEMDKIDLNLSYKNYLKESKNELNEEYVIVISDYKNQYNSIINEIETEMEEICSKNDNCAFFLRSIGGIARESEMLSKRLYSELYDEFIYNNKTYIENLDTSIIQKYFSSWIKKCLNLEKDINDNDLFSIICHDNIKIIEKYYKENNSEINNFIEKIFVDLTRIYSICLMSQRAITFKYAKENSEFNKTFMVDIESTYSGEKNVNFTVLPGLSGESGNIFEGNSKIYVYTYPKEKFYFKDIVYPEEYSKYSITDKKNKNIIMNPFIKISLMQNKDSNSRPYIKAIPNLDLSKYGDFIFYFYKINTNIKNTKIQPLFQNKEGIFKIEGPSLYKCILSLNGENIAVSQINITSL